jgi:lysophospholipase L1-like esterase
MNQPLRIVQILILSVLATGCMNPGKLDPYRIPKLKGIEVDGDITEWKGRGLKIPLVANRTGEINPGSFSSTVYLAWDQNALYLMTEVEDDSIFIDSTGPSYRSDGMELFIAPVKGSKKMIQYSLNPNFDGIDRVFTLEFATGASSAGSNDLRYASRRTRMGYTMEVAIPFGVIGFSTDTCKELAFNFYINDADSSESTTRYGWHYHDNTYLNHDALYTLSLGRNKRGHGLLVRAWLEDNEMYHTRVIAFSGSSSANLQLQSDNWTKGQDSIVEDMKYSVSSYSFPLGDAPQNENRIDLYAGENRLSSIEWADIPRVYVHTLPPNRFENEIVLYEKNDAKDFPPTGAVLFVGSSSIRLWRTLEEDFPNTRVINRGFGGSKTTDVMHYFDRIVLPYKPSVIVYYTGTNDLGSGDSPGQVVARVEEFIQRVQSTMPGTRVILLSHVPGVIRKHLTARFLEANELTIGMIRKYPHVEYLDVTTPLLTEQGIPRPDVFLADSLHLNPEGYKVWKEALSPLLLEKQ